MPKRVLALCGSPRAAPFNPDLETSLPDGVRRLHDAVATSDALLVASPEYAHGVTAVAIFNASPRSVHAEAGLRGILTTMSARIVAEACVALPFRSTGIGEQGILESEHAPAIRRALCLLAAGAPRA